MAEPLRVLILGGYGTFGGRLVRMLADLPGLTLIVAGRSAEKARAFIAGLDGRTAMEARAVDRNGDLTAALTDIAPDLVVDCSGPFQVYRDRPYRVAEAALAADIDYFDIADGAGFVAGIAQFDDAAKAAGRSVLSGVSTFPALSSAVIRDLSEGWQRVDRVTYGLAPSPHAGLGQSVVSAILTYAGKPVTIIRGGKRTTAPGLVDSRKMTVAPPGAVLPMDRLRFSLVEVPDEATAPAIWPLRSYWAGVGTRPQIMLRALNWVSRLVQWGVVPTLSPLAKPAFIAMRTLRWGAHRGGMVISVGGLDAEGKPATREWHMIAEGDDGPDIPAIAAATLIRHRLDGDRPAPGARPATDEASLADYEHGFAERAITTGIREHLDAERPLYERMLGSVWPDLPPAVRAMHAAPDGLKVSGTATVERGVNPISRLVGKLVGFPKEGETVPVEVEFTVKGDGELWQRRFAGRPFESFQKPGTGSFEHLLSERFGPLEFGLALLVKDERLWLVTRGWRAFGMPMPRFLAPGGDAYEFEQDGRFHFHVEIRHWLTGLIVRYRGSLSRSG